MKQFFSLNKIDDSITRALGAGLTIAIPLILGNLLNNVDLASLGVLGGFSYLAFQRKSLIYNLKATSLHFISLILCFLLGFISGKNIEILPFTASLLTFAGFSISKIYNIPKPGHFFCCMLFACGVGFPFEYTQLSKVLLFLSVGGISGIFIAVFISLIENLPIFKEQQQNLSFKELLRRAPKSTFIQATNFAFITFISAYVAYLLFDCNGYWLLISSFAILLGEEQNIITKRTYHRIIGGVIGLLIGFVLSLLNLNLFAMSILIVVFNVLIEFFMPRNYAIANFWTNPLVLMLTMISTTTQVEFLIQSRFLGIVLGSLIPFLLFILVNKSLDFKKNFLNQ